MTKPIFLSRLLFLASVSISTVVTASPLATYDFTGLSGGELTLEAASSATSITSSAISRGPAYAGYAATFSANGLGTQPGLVGDESGDLLKPYTIETAVSLGAYFELSLEVDPEFAMNVDSILLGTRRASHNTGPNFVAVRSSLDGFATDVLSGVSTAGLGGTASSSVFLDLGTAFQNVPDSLTIRIYGYGRNADNTSRGIFVFSNPDSNATVGDVTFGAEGSGNFSVNGTVIPEPSTYALIAALTGFGAVLWRRRK